MLNQKIFCLTLDVFRVGAKSLGKSNLSNCYLIRDYNEVVLINPGSERGFFSVLSDLQDLLRDLGDVKLKGILFGSESPSFCSCLPSLSVSFPDVPIYVHPEAVLDFKQFDVTNEIVPIDIGGVAFKFTSGRIVESISLPFLPTKNSLVFYDDSSKIIFSGYLCSSSSPVVVLSDGINGVNAYSQFLEKFIDVVPFIIKTIRQLENKDIKIVAPHYGEIIKGNVLQIFELIKAKYIDLDNELNIKEKEFFQQNTNQQANNEWHNALSFIEDIVNQISKSVRASGNLAVMIMDIDNLSQINHLYGNNIGNETIKNIAFFLKEKLPAEAVLYKLSGPAFACSFVNKTRSEIFPIADEIRNELSKSNLFVQKMTISVGLVSLDEIKTEIVSSNDIAQMMLKLCRNRVAIAKTQGMNLVCYSSSIYEDIKHKPKVLIIDNDETSYEILSVMMGKIGWMVSCAKDGIEALTTIEKMMPDIIISELIIPKIGGFEIRERLMEMSEFKRIPFMVLSYRKNDETIKRAISLGIVHYFRKPYNLQEVMGIASYLVKRTSIT